jgi:hypothetical protein
MPDTPETTARLHEAIQDYLDEGELALSWVLTIDVAGPDGTRYLAHRAGGGAEGQDSPMVWTAFGMLRASAAVAEQQLLSSTRDADDESREP